MKYLIASDIHGSHLYAKKIKELFEVEKANKLVLLGDLYYHGPRNPFPDEYNPKEVCTLLNSMKNSIICTRGNCDAEVDQMISEFKLVPNKKIKLGDKTIMFTHGHKFNIDHPAKDVDILIYGHFHTGFIKEKDGKLFVNSGSVSLPKDGTQNSYLILDESGIYLKNMSGEIIDSKAF